MRILIIHASAGNGHKRAAEAVARAYAEDRPGLFEVDVVDALDLAPARFKRFYVGSFESSVKRAPWLFGALFRASSEAARFRPYRALRRSFNRAVAARLLADVRRRDPDVVICTHFLALDVLAREKRAGRLDAALACVVTDYVTHGFWVEPACERYYAPCEAVANDLWRRGVPRAAIRVTGMPVDPAFARPLERDEARLALGIPAARKSILVLGGGLGMGPVAEIVSALGARVDLPIAIDVVCGKNAALKAEVEALARTLPVPVRVHGFVGDVPARMAAADLVVTKPGGLTTSETIALGRPTLLFEAMPGQERGNADHFVGAGAALEIEPATAGETLAALLDEPARLETLVERARALARPEAARAIAADAARLRRGVRRIGVRPGLAGIAG